jgi:predicted PurR-regulated permease PerM
VAEPNADVVSDAARARAREARMHYAPAEARALGALALAAAAAILWVILPVGIGVLMGTLMAFATLHTYKRLARKTRRPALAALGVTTLTTLIVAGAIGALVYLLILQGVSVLGALPEALAPGARAAHLIDRLFAPLRALHLQPQDIAARLRDALGGMAASMAGWAAQAVSLVFDAILALFFMAMTMHFVLLHWSQLSRRAEYLMPLNPRHTRRLMRELRRIGRTVIVGNFGTALVQGAIAGVGYFVAQLPQPALLGAITAVASLLPAFGTMLVWVPAGLVLLLGGHPAAGVFELAWGAFAVAGLSDYVVRPRLVGRGDTTSSWMTFVALFGGLKLFGAVGLLLGPLLVGISRSALRLYERTRRFRLGLS